ncbi:EAL domain-containing protein [bacterium]|nr:EAL domain-containing protein [bacterium]
MDLNYRKINNLNERNYKKLLKNYKFNQEDASCLKSLRSVVNNYSKELLSGFYKFIFEFDHARMFLHNKEILLRHERGIQKWYLNLFSGVYDENYFEKLYIISEIHVRIGLPAHYVNAAFSYVRGFLKNILIKEKKYEVLGSVDKIIDINLDILTIAYREEEQSKLVDDIVFLKNVVENSNIEPYFQGIYDAKTTKINKYESLMRLIDPKSKEVFSVFSFLQTAKKIKLYEKMMEIMIEKTFEIACPLNMEFSINLCYEDISNRYFREYIYKKINTCNKAENIIFEILESDFIEDFNIVKDFATHVRTFGCKIAIDDFGSGYSSMENILKLKPDIIKIDGSLIKNIDTSLESKTIVKNIVNMAKELNAKTVAEYVLSKEVYEVVKTLDIDFLQGFYLAEPEAIEVL